DGTVDLLAEHIDDKDVARLEHVDGELVRERRLPMRFGLGLRNSVNVGALRHKLDGEGASDHGLAGMKDLESVGPLVLVSLLLEFGPNFFGGEAAGTFQQSVRHFGTAIRETLEGRV